MIKAGIVGLGWWGKTLVESAENSDVIKFVAGTTHTRAIVWADGQLHDLNDLIAEGGAGWRLTSAQAISPRGLIVGEGVLNGVRHAFLATPLP